MANGFENRMKIEEIKRQLKVGEISYDDAKAQAEPIIREINESMKIVAKRHGKRHHGVTFSYLMR